MRFEMHFGKVSLRPACASPVVSGPLKEVGDVRLEGIRQRARREEVPHTRGDAADGVVAGKTGDDVLFVAAHTLSRAHQAFERGGTHTEGDAFALHTLKTMCCIYARVEAARKLRSSLGVHAV